MNKSFSMPSWTTNFKITTSPAYHFRSSAPERIPYAITSSCIPPYVLRYHVDAKKDFRMRLRDSMAFLTIIWPLENGSLVLVMADTVSLTLKHTLGAYYFLPGDLQSWQRLWDQDQETYWYRI